MRFFLSVLLSGIIIHSASGQTIGLKGNTGFSSIEETDYEAGTGVYVYIYDFYEKVEILFSFDFNKSNIAIHDDIQTNYKRAFFSAAGLYVFPISKKLKFKTGAVITHENMKLTQTKTESNWIHNYYSKYLGVGLMVDLQYQKLFNLPLNLNLFVSPAYLANIHMGKEPYISNNEFINDLSVLNVQLGLAYVIKPGK